MDPLQKGLKQEGDEYTKVIIKRLSFVFHTGFPKSQLNALISKTI